MIKKYSKKTKISLMIVLIILITIISIGIPTFAKYKYRQTVLTTSTWDGSIATSYNKGNGTIDDPYVISNGSELAYFSNELNTNNYKDTFFSLNNDIVLNKGLFSYDETNGLTYTINNITYYIKEYTNEYYDNIERNGNPIGTVNLFNSLNNFNGTFIGNAYSIYGLYITSSSLEELALFTSLKGTVTDLYVENSLIHGGNTTGGISAVSNNAKIERVLFNGFVINNDSLITKNKKIDINDIDINLQDSSITNSIDLINNIPFMDSTIISTSITGEYSIQGNLGESKIKLNDNILTDGTFNINLGNDIKSNLDVTLTASLDSEVTITFTNLKYNITYNQQVAGGISAISMDSNISSTINKGTIYSNGIGGSLIGLSVNTNLNNSYNTGNVTGTSLVGGLIGGIDKTTNNTITKVYNNGEVNSTIVGSLIGKITDSTINIDKSFNTFDTPYYISNVVNSTVNVINSYSLYGELSIGINGNLSIVTLDNLLDKNFIINNLSFNEYVEKEEIDMNKENIWVYENNTLPLLYLDETIASIHLGLHSWNNYNSILNNYYYNSSVSFSILNNDDLVPYKEAYYYISNSSTPLSLSDLNSIDSWINFSNIVNLTEENNYVIYAKIVDNNDRITYLNTDLITIDLTDPLVSINNEWSTLNNSPKYTYIDTITSYTVTTNDNLSTADEVYYHIASNVLNIEQLNNLTSWNDYEDNIEINNMGTNIIYVKVVDKSGNMAIINSDYIVYNGYSVNSLTLGRNNSYLTTDKYITSKSIFSLNYTYQALEVLPIGYTHNLVSNISLPINTKITLIDNHTNKVYNYLVSEETNHILFNSFEEVGSTTTKYFDEDIYNSNIINENFDIIVDLSKTNITTNYDEVSFYLEVRDSSNNKVLTTLDKDKKKINIYSLVNGIDTTPNVTLTKDYNDTINMNSNSTTNINLNGILNYTNYNEYRIIDTNYENKILGLSLRIVDNNNNVVDKSLYNNILFSLGNIEYYPESDSITRINLNNGLNNLNNTLTITTKESKINLESGTYYLKIALYNSYTGRYYKLLDNELSIPLRVVNNRISNDYIFDVITPNNGLINKNDTNNLIFNVIEEGEFTNPNLRISLYRKTSLTAYNQDYTLIDLKDYINNNLILISNNVYYLSNNPISYDGTSNTYNSLDLSLKNSSFNKTGYKVVIDLYDDNKYIDSIEKYFIVK